MPKYFSVTLLITSLMTIKCKVLIRKLFQLKTKTEKNLLLWINRNNFLLHSTLLAAFNLPRCSFKSSLNKHHKPQGTMRIIRKKCFKNHLPSKIFFVRKKFTCAFPTFAIMIFSSLTIMTSHSSDIHYRLRKKTKTVKCLLPGKININSTK